LITQLETTSTAAVRERQRFDLALADSTFEARPGGVRAG
jgi:hypothetical protein